MISKRTALTATLLSAIMAGMTGCASMFTTPLKDCAALCRTDKVELYLGDDGQRCQCSGAQR